MAKKGGSLTFPSNPLAAMQELSELDAPQAQTEENAQTEKIAAPLDTYSNTEISNQVSTPISKSVSTDLSKERQAHPIGEAAHRLPPQRVEGQSRVSSSPKASAKEAAPPAALPARVQTARQRLLGQAEKEAVSRLSIDVPIPLYNRIKQYVAVNNVESIRALTLALYEDFLTEEQF